MKSQEVKVTKYDGKNVIGNIEFETKKLSKFGKENITTKSFMWCPELKGYSETTKN